MNGSGLWKTLFLMSVSALVGILGGEFIPNRNIATTADVAAISGKLDTMATSNASEALSLQSQISDLKGQVRGLSRIGPTDH